jgi:hypothetical protein
MATPSPATTLPTRQQLDEIDALLRRMLSLPPLPGEPAAPESPPASPAVTYSAPTVREVSPPRDPQPGDPVVREWRAEWSPAPAPQGPSVVAWGSPVPAAAPVHLPPAAAPAPTYAVPATAEQFPFAAPVTHVPGQPPPSAARPPAALPIQLLVLLNGTFNVLTYLLGPLGTWLRGPGRTALGWCGVLMLLVAGVWAAGEWRGFDWPAIDLSRIGGPTLGR